MAAVLLDAGADPKARTADTIGHRVLRRMPQISVLGTGITLRAGDKPGKSPADLAIYNEKVKNHPVLWKLKQVRFD